MNAETWQIIMTAVGSLGFPIVMCLILVFRLETTIKELTTAIISLKELFIRVLPHSEE